MNSFINPIKLYFMDHDDPPLISTVAKKDIQVTFNHLFPGFRDIVNTYLHQRFWSLSATYDFDIDLKELFGHCRAVSPDGHNVGSLALEYVEGFIRELEKYTRDGTYKPARDAFNTVVSRRKIKITANDGLPIESPSGCRVVGRIFEINYHPEKYGFSMSEACRDLAKEIDKELLKLEITNIPVLARISVEKEWTEKQTDLKKRLREEINSDVELEVYPSWEAIWKVLASAEKQKPDRRHGDLIQVAERFGLDIYQYFNVCVSQIKDQIKKDATKVEIFRRRLTGQKIKLEVVEDGKLEVGVYHECKFDNGALLLRVTASKFGNQSWVATAIETLFTQHF